MQAEQVGEKFESMLWLTLGEERYCEAAARNLRETNPAICHTHDFCDANQIMLDAFKEALGCDLDMQNEADMAIIDAAWAVCRRRMASKAQTDGSRSFDRPAA